MNRHERRAEAAQARNSEPQPEPTLVAVPIELMKRFADIVDRAGCREPVYKGRGVVAEGGETDDVSDWKLCGDQLPGATPPFVVCDACKVRMEVGALLAAFTGMREDPDTPRTVN